MKNPNQLKKAINFKCATCQSIYQLLEILKGNNNNCSDNCLKRWKETLQQHYQKEIMSHLSEQEEAKDELVEKIKNSLHKN